MNNLAVCVACVLLFSCSPNRSFDHDYFAIGVSQGILNNAEIDEASGLAASVLYKDMFWTHNDSGDEARIFLIDKQGRHKATVTLRDVENRDWEDIAVGPGPASGKSYIYIGDIGDNNAAYEHKYLYRIEEPVLTLSEDAVDTVVENIDKISFQLSDKPRDTEALMIDSETKNIYILSKRESEKVNLYVLPYPQSTTEVMTAEFLTHVPLTQISGADISADGNELLLKNYKHVYYWKRQPGESIQEVLQRKPANLPYTEEPQGEAITFCRQGKGYYTLSEETNNKKPHLIFYKRKE